MGFTGVGWIQHWYADYGAMVLTKADYARQPAEEWQAAARWFNGLRKVVPLSVRRGA